MEYHSNNNTHRDGAAAVHAASGSKNRKPATAQQLIRENVKYLIEQLEAGHSETLTAYLNAMANFHTYSFGNVLLIARQRPQATHVAGIRTWNELGRRVKRGEKGIAILAPMIGKRRKKENTEAATENEANTSTLLGFRRVFVWDEFQTEGASLPSIGEVTAACCGGVSAIGSHGYRHYASTVRAPECMCLFGSCVARSLPDWHDVTHNEERRARLCRRFDSRGRGSRTSNTTGQLSISHNAS